MPRTEPGTGPGAPSAAGEAAALAAFLRRLADAVERDVALGARLAALARASGLALTGPEAERRPAVAARGRATPPAEDAPDPFALLRERGEDGLRAALASLDPPTLRAIIRSRRLDPARISARWTARDRLVGLIVEQVRARASHGRAFEHV